MGTISLRSDYKWGEGASFSFEYDEDCGVIFIHLIGVYNPGVSLQLIDSSIVSMEKYNCNKLLLDLLQGSIQSSVLDTVYRTESVRKSYNVNLNKVAFVTNEIDEELKFLESSYRILGLEFLSFTSMNSAMLWLNS